MPPRRSRAASPSSSSLGIEDQALLHGIAKTGVPIDVFTLDTGRHFPETLETLEASEQAYGLNIRVMFPDARDVEELVARDGIMGFRQSIEARKACCHVRKVLPLNRALEGAAGWVTGPAPRSVVRARRGAVRAPGTPSTA